MNTENKNQYINMTKTDIMENKSSDRIHIEECLITRIVWKYPKKRKYIYKQQTNKQWRQSGVLT
jgi:hypothetical protein